MAKCPRCGVDYDVGASYCGGCGAPLAPGGAPGRPDTAPGPAPTQTLEAYPPAPRIRRLVAAAIDLAIGMIFLLPAVALPQWMLPFVKVNLFSRALRFIPALYLLLRDSLGGRSVGKALMGLVTYDRNEGRPANVVDSVVRNWPLALAVIPWIGWILSGGLSLIIAAQILAGRPQRFGDGFATTQVIEEKCLAGA